MEAVSKIDEQGSIGSREDKISQLVCHSRRLVLGSNLQVGYSNDDVVTEGDLGKNV